MFTTHGDKNPNHLGFNYFDAILYINLEHRTDRKELLLEELKRFHVPDEKIHRIEAIWDPLNGHKGCALSHIKALEFAIKHEFKRPLILEDDFMCTRSPREVEEMISFFDQTVGSLWDVFLIGSRIKRFQRTPIPRIFRAISSQCAHGYSVNSHYLTKLHDFFRTCYEEMKTDRFFFESVSIAIDQKWDSLMEKDHWLFIEIISQQRPCVSDTDHVWRERTMKETF